MSLLNEQIDVQSNTSGQPSLFAWRGSVYRVRRVIGVWTGSSAPASGEPEAQQRLLRVATESDQGRSSIVDISQDPRNDSWTVRRLWNN